MTGKQLKNSILQWAIQGKLVPQDPNDEPASVLLERIRTEKARLVKEKKIKRNKNESIIYRGEDNSYYEKMADGTVRCIDSEIPFAIPGSWAWCRLRDICSMQAGKNIKSTEISKVRNENYRFRCVGGNGLRGYTSNYNHEGNHAIVGRQGALCGCLNRENGKFYATEHAVVVDTFNILSDAFMYYFLTALNLNQYATATAQPGLAVSTIIEVLCPLPPLPEQHRIIATIEAITPLITIYQDNQKRLNTLNTSISLLFKKSILQEAIQGRLVPQIESEGTAEQLLAEIAEEKKRLVKEGKLKKSALTASRIFRGDDNRYYEQIGSQTLDITEEIPFEIPHTWAWVRLSTIADAYTGNSISEVEKKSKYTNVEGRFYIGTKDIGFDNQIIYNNGIAIPEQFENNFKIAPKSSVLMCIEGGSAGRKIAFLNQDVCFGNKLCCFSPFVAMGPYIYYYLQSSSFFDVFCQSKSGIIGGVSIGKIKDLLIPIPPKRESMRIVTKIETLFKRIK